MINSAHHLSEAKIGPKFYENLSKGNRDMEWTRNSRLELVTFHDLNIDSAWLNYVNVRRH